MKHYDVAIIGAGTAGLSARREVAKKTDNYVVIDDGVLGTTCARVGCMPSKVLIQVANDYHRREVFDQLGIRGGEKLSIDPIEVMKHVRSLRDRFVTAVRKDMTSWEEKLIRKRARFVDAHTLNLGDETIRANRIVIATGSAPIVPEAWKHVAHRLIDTDGFFEIEKLPKRIAVVGLGVIGLELGQALHRLGIEVIAITAGKAYGGLSDPALQDYTHRQFSKEFDTKLGRVTELSEQNNELVIRLDTGDTVSVDAALLTMGRKPNLESLGIGSIAAQNPAIQLNRGLPAFDTNTFRVNETPWYLVGDVNGRRPLLHEAADEGRIAGYNAVRADEQSSDQCFRPRTSLTITFSAPNIAIVGESHQQLTERGANYVIGKVSYEGQGRAIVKLAECGLLHVYADQSSGALLGAELLAPNGEHLAHLLSWAIAANMTVQQTLSLPFYHPVLEEGVRTALRDAARQVAQNQPALEVFRCDDPPAGALA